jgi:5-deoxy-D-glucuronate isomerase
MVRFVRQVGPTATDLRNFVSQVVAPFIKACVHAKTTSRKQFAALMELMGHQHIEVVSLQVAQAITAHEQAFNALIQAEAGVAGWNPQALTVPWKDMQNLLTAAKSAEVAVSQKLASLRQAKRIANNQAGSEARQDANAVRRITTAMHRTGFPQELYTWLLRKVCL